MELFTSWVRPLIQTGGLDHLAVQAPCINIYGRLLPGITNVTDRARYYTFYPWIIWALEQAGYRFNKDFIDKYRRADCLFTLIAHRHSHTTKTDHEDHAGATIGSANLAKQLSEIKENKSVRISDFSHNEEIGKKYFKNKLGGLGQYYLGVFRELNIMDGSVGAGIKNTNQFGKIMAEAMDQGVNKHLFLKTLNEDLVSVNRLDDLSSFCPCQLNSNPREQRILSDLFFVRGLFSDPEMMSRRNSLQTILHLANELAKQNISISLEQFRGCTYSNALPNGEIFELPEKLNQNRRRWAVYQTNELLSLAVQGIFYVLLDVYADSDSRIDSIEDLCQWFLKAPEIEHISAAFNLSITIKELEKIADHWLPEFTDWTNEHHEVQLASRIFSLCKKDKTVDNRSAILEAALKVLIALKKRPECQGGYLDFVFPGNYFQVYPINLESFLLHSCKTWNDLTVRGWLIWLCDQWGIKAHFRNALRKLRSQSQSTFRIRPSDQGLEVISVPEAVFTSPRFHQTIRILKDIKALINKEGRWVVSKRGQELMDITDE